MEMKETSGRPVAFFSLGDVWEGFNWRWLDLDVCRRWVLERLYPDGPRCPYCGGPVREGAATAAWWRCKRVCCHLCGRWYRATKGTFLHHAIIDIRQVLVLAWAYNLGASAAQAAALAGVDHKTARLWRVRLTISEMEDLTE